MVLHTTRHNHMAILRLRLSEAKNSRSFVAQKHFCRLGTREVRRRLFLATKERCFFLKEDVSSLNESDGISGFSYWEACLPVDKGAYTIRCDSTHPL